MSIGETWAPAAFALGVARRVVALRGVADPGGRGGVTAIAGASAISNVRDAAVDRALTLLVRVAERLPLLPAGLHTRDAAVDRVLALLVRVAERLPRLKTGKERAFAPPLNIG